MNGLALKQLPGIKTMTINNYWPTIEEINNCIKDQAENSSDAVLLAVHQKFPLAYSIVGPDGNVMKDSKQSASEEDFLKYFLSDAPSGSHVVPITGRSGVGKSHLVRILDAKIKRLTDADKYLVIRIPKSASLRKVVDLILSAEPLQGSQYDSVRAEFSKAMVELKIEDAVITFFSQLQIALKDYGREQREALSQDVTNTVIKRKIAHAEYLPLLMSDGEMVDHFREKVLPRIIQRSVKGGDSGPDSDEFDPNSIKFKIEDFDFEGIDIANSNQRVSKYYQINFLGDSSHERDLAVEVLNDVVDRATNQLYKLNQSLGGMTLGEVILEIRKLLLKDNRELILLVEDFAALVGIQETLAKVLIQEGATSEGVKYATIRSAIAVTDGYLGGKNTLATRAGREWVVESSLDSETETLDRTKKLVASYLNAARIGEKGLKNHYDNLIKKDPRSNFSVPIYRDDDIGDLITQLHSFGSIDEIPLFPFSDNAIEFLARQTSLRSGNSLIFNPRYIIKNIIRLILVHRESFLDGNFPPNGIISRGPQADVQNWISGLEVSQELKGQYQRLVTIWGNNPETRNEIPHRIKNDIYTAFSLKVPELNASSSSAKIPEKNKPKEIEAVETPSIDARLEAKIRDCKQALDDWITENKRLDQGIANVIRRRISSELSRKIDWNAERTLEIEIKPQQIIINNAGGSGNAYTENTIELIGDVNNPDPDGRLRIELLALYRNDECSKLKLYPGLDDDLARISNLIERLIPQALISIGEINKKHTNSVITALNLNGKVLGFIENNPSTTYIDQTLFANGDPTETLPLTASEKFKEWIAFKDSALLTRSALQKSLLQANGCFQGTGDTCYGVDIIKILDHYPEVNEQVIYEDIINIEPSTKSLLQGLSDARVEARIKGLKAEIEKIVDSINSEFGDQFDKNLIAETFKRIALNLKDSGRFNEISIGLSFNEFSKLTDEFRDSSIKDSLTIYSKYNSPDLPANKRISNFGRLQLTPLSISNRFIFHATKLVTAVENEVKLLGERYKGINKQEKIDAINSLFSEILENLSTIEKDAQDGTS